jgi:hypothetical protein
MFIRPASEDSLFSLGYGSKFVPLRGAYVQYGAARKLGLLLGIQDRAGLNTEMGKRNLEKLFYYPCNTSCISDPTFKKVTDDRFLSTSF